MQTIATKARTIMIPLPIIAFIALSTGCTMPDANNQNIHVPKSPVETMDTKLAKPAPDAAQLKETKALDAQVSSIFRNGYSVASSNYYHVAANVTWASIEKNVQNEMQEHSISKSRYDGENPGIVLIDFYPQRDGAFVVAMDNTTASKDEKLIGYYVLKATKRAD